MHNLEFEGEEIIRGRPFFWKIGKPGNDTDANFVTINCASGDVILTSNPPPPPPTPEACEAINDEDTE